MAKILINNTVNNISITDTGITLPASSSYTIPPQDYTLWASSSDIITKIGSGDVTVNDGSYDLSKADGISLLQGNFKQIDFVSSLIDNDGRLKISLAQDTPNDFLSKVSSNDSTAGYLEDKIIGTTNKITVTTLNDGSFEELQINIGSHVFDKSFDDASNVTNVPYGNISATNVQSALNELDLEKQAISEKGQPNGYASLDSSGKVPSAQLPAYVDDVLEYANLASFPVTGSTGIIYVALDNNKCYRWSGSTYIEISPSEVTSVNGQTGTVTLTTSNINEGSNLYFTDERAQDAVGTILTDTSSIDFTYNDVGNSITASVIASGVDHNSLNNLTTGDVHTQYALLNGRSGGQTLNGGSGASQNLTLSSTTNVSKGSIIIGTNNVFNEGTNKFGINTLTPLSEASLVTSSSSQIRGFSNFNYTSGTDSGKFIAGKSRGTESSPSQILTSDVLGNYSYFGRGTTQFLQGAAIRAVAQQPFTDTAAGTQLEFQVAANNTTGMQTALTIAQNKIVSTADAIRPGNSSDATAGNIRYSGTDLEGYVGGSWKSLTTQTGNLIYSRNASTTLISTTSTAYVIVTGMFVVPESGTYLVFGRSTVSATSNSRFISLSIYRNGSLVSDSETQVYIRNGSGFFSNTDILNIGTDAVVTVNGSEQVDLRWKTSGGTVQAQGYSLILIKVG